LLSSTICLVSLCNARRRHVESRLLNQDVIYE
jgi:hypothetical protein